MLGIEHDSQSSTHSLGWQVLSEHGTNDAVLSVSLDNPSPNCSVLCVLLYRFRLVNVHDSLAKIVCRSLGIIHSFEVHESLVLMLFSLSSSEARELSFHPESISLVNLIADST